MEITKLLSILRNPIGIESDVVEEARLEAADMLEFCSDCDSDCENKKPEFPQEDSCYFKPDDFIGAPKNNISEDKPDMSELPLDLLTELLCPAYKEGSLHKYYRNSWRKGFKLSVMFAACLRHLTKFFFMRETYDQETLKKYGIKKHHLGAAMFCIIAMYNDWKNYPENDDRCDI